MATPTMVRIGLRAFITVPSVEGSFAGLAASGAPLPPTGNASRVLQPVRLCRQVYTRGGPGRVEDKWGPD